jgi:hypothetical protein
MAAPHCSALTRQGTPCHARPRPGSRFCYFHDLARSAAFAAGRRKGGAAPNRRLSQRRAAAADTDLLLHLFMAALADQSPSLLEALDHSSSRSHSRHLSPAALLAASEVDTSVDRR